MSLSQCVTLLRVAWFGYRNQCPERNTISPFRWFSRLLAAVCWVTLSRTVTRSQVLVDSDRSNSDSNCYWFHPYYYNIMGVELSLRRHRLVRRVDDVVKSWTRIHPPAATGGVHDIGRHPPSCTVAGIPVSSPPPMQAHWVPGLANRTAFHAQAN
mgnify:CR=1 FL=1